MMGKATFAIKINEKVIEDFKKYCDSHGIKYSFFVEDAIRKKLREEELKDDLLDLKFSAKKKKMLYLLKNI